MTVTRGLAGVVLACAAAVAFALPASTVRAQTEAPEATPSGAATTLPDIGRTRTRPLCTTLRDIVAPAIVTAQHADVQFSEARPVLFDYLAGDAASAGMRLRKIERAVIEMARDVVKLKALVADPRLAGETDDTATGETKARADLRASLRVIYESELRQLNALNGFVETDRRLTLSARDEDSMMMQAAFDGMTPPPAIPTSPSQANYLGHPPHYANKLSQAHEVDRWMGRVVTLTTTREEAASKVIVAVAALCR